MQKTHMYTNALFRKITFIYTIVLLVMGFIAGYLAYSKENSAVFNKLDKVMVDLKHEYESSTDNFWRLYMPIFQHRDTVYSAMRRYFLSNSESDWSPIDKKNLFDALQTVMSSDDEIEWIGVYSGREQKNYLLFEGEANLQEMPDDFPFIEDMDNKGPSMEVFGSRLVNRNGKSIRCFALCGGTALDMKGGKIIVGYRTENIAYAHLKAGDSQNADFFIVNDWGLVYDSTDAYKDNLEYTVKPGVSFRKDGKLIFTRKLSDTDNSYSVYCQMPWLNLFVRNHVFTPFIVLIVVVFWVCSRMLYRWAGNIIIRKINAIQYGLHKIGDNELDYRIPVTDPPTDEFEGISQSINEVAIRLQENIDKAYLSKLKQKEAELSELQAKFDPHFLYNTLEVIRGKVYENGDDETADIIVKLAQIFRRFIGSDTFISIREEMEFCNLYLSLLKYRYDNEVKIIYDVESEILEYGIIRNLLQPVLENYFVHGFQPRKHDNMLVIRGKLKDDAYVRFLIRDNGLGITDERLAELKNNLDAVATGAKSSYGLKNVNKRIKLFYGEECGLEIDKNEEGGATIEIRIRKLTCQEHEERMYIDV